MWFFEFVISCLTNSALPITLWNFKILKSLNFLTDTNFHQNQRTLILVVSLSLHLIIRSKSLSRVSLLVCLIYHSLIVHFSISCWPPLTLGYGLSFLVTVSIAFCIWYVSTVEYQNHTYVSSLFVNFLLHIH